MDRKAHFEIRFRFIERNYHCLPAFSVTCGFHFKQILLHTESNIKYWPVNCGSKLIWHRLLCVSWELFLIRFENYGSVFDVWSCVWFQPPSYFSSRPLHSSRIAAQKSMCHRSVQVVIWWSIVWWIRRVGWETK